MIGQPRRHRWGPRPPAALPVRLAQRPHLPTIVVAVHAEVRHRFVHLPILREAVRLAHLPGVEIAVRSVVALDEGRVDRPTDSGVLQGPLDRLEGTENRPDDDLLHARPFSRLLRTVA